MWLYAVNVVLCYSFSQYVWKGGAGRVVPAVNLTMHGWWIGLGRGEREGCAGLDNMQPLA